MARYYWYNHVGDLHSKRPTLFRTEKKKTLIEIIRLCEICVNRANLRSDRLFNSAISLTRQKINSEPPPPIVEELCTFPFVAKRDQRSIVFQRICNPTTVISSTSDGPTFRFCKSVLNLSSISTMGIPRKPGSQNSSLK